ncbi:SGS domain protein [Ancylostoma duodenale]|uniref:SGS domain protein n=1 Tax=Ancylostoma duodenale TaxID=51022 RepID=A0A0C2C4W3_9BILA|nr:SGS domain protein [Ancylostoma duodenale]
MMTTKGRVLAYGNSTQHFTSRPPDFERVMRLSNGEKCMVEVRMPKASAGHWPMLGASSAAPTPVESHHPPKNWEAIERKVVEEEENEQLEGDAAVNRMFRKLYNEASDDVKRAMIKSYQ